MAEGLDLSEILRRTAQVNAKFYKGWLDLTLEYFRGISEVFSGPEAPTTPAGEPDADVVVLEAEEGAAAQGAFLVTNDLGRTLSCELVVSEFRDPDGAPVGMKVTFEPAMFQVEPGEQRVVRVVVPIDGRLAEGVAYAGEFAIKGMEGFSVPVILRRLHRVEESPAGSGESGTAAAAGMAKTPSTTPATGLRKAATKRAAGDKGLSKKAPRNRQ